MIRIMMAAAVVELKASTGQTMMTTAPAATRKR